MASMTSWFAVGSAALAVGHWPTTFDFGELGSGKAAAVTDGQVQRVTQGATVVASVAAGTLTRNEATDVEADDARQRVMAARIEEKYQRVEVAVGRIDQVRWMVEERVEARWRNVTRSAGVIGSDGRAASNTSKKEATPKGSIGNDVAIEVGMSSLGMCFVPCATRTSTRGAQDEMGAIRDELDVALTEILGEDEAEKFQRTRGPGRSWRRR